MEDSRVGGMMKKRELGNEPPLLGKISKGGISHG